MPASVHEDQDQSMVDADAQQENGEVIEVGENRITIVRTSIPQYAYDYEGEKFYDWLIQKLSGATDTAASFQFKEEGHTLGNALRYVIMKKYLPSSPSPHHDTIRLDDEANAFKAPKSNSAATRFRIRQKLRWIFVFRHTVI